MYKSIIKIALLLCFMSINLMVSQELPDLIPPSPTAYELGKYGDIPINESTGMASINIPFFNYSVGSINLGISIDYTASGIKVDQVASWVGMGWNLNAGGVITRTVRGNPDDLYQISYDNSFSGIESLYNQNNLYYYNFLAEVNDAKESGKDYEPDVYNFNVNGLSGSFVLDENSEPLLLKRDNLAKIEKVTNGFKITGTNGLEYLFTTKEFNATRTPCSKGGESLADEAITAWYLTTITALNGDEVTLNYVDNNYIYASGYNSTYGKIYTSGITECEGAQVPDSPGVKNCVTYSHLKNKKITSIINNRNNQNIVFSHSNSRGDLPSAALKLDAVYLNEGTELIKGYELNHELITSTHNTQNTLLDSNEYKKRLFLKNVKELSENDSTVDGKSYAFEYNDPSNLPPRFSFAQDLLGFYNNQNSNYSLLPQTNSPNGSYLGYTPANRSSNFIYASKGILTKVIYPTKGWTTLDYEPDVEIITDYSYQQSNFNLSTNTNVNIIKTQQLTSLFLQQIIIAADVTVNTGVDIVHDRMLYTVTDLTTSQIVLDENVGVGSTSAPVKLLKDHVYEFKIDLSPVKEDEVTGAISFTYYSNVFENNLQNQTGIRVKKVKNKANVNANEVTKRYYYNSIDNYDQEPLLIYQQYAFSELLEKRIKCNPVPAGAAGLSYQLFSVNSGGWDPIYRLTNRLNKYTHVTVSHGGDNFENGASEKQFSKIFNSVNFDFGRGTINNATTSNEALFNGTLLRETDFIKNGNDFDEVRMVVYDYEIDASKTKSVNGYIGRNKSSEYSYSYPITNYLNTSSLDFLQLNHYYVHSMFNKLKSKKTINYFENGNLETNENYFYDGANDFLLSKNETVKSNGDVIKTETEYAQDVNDITLISQNRISEPIQVKTFKKVGSNPEQKLSEQKTIYNTFGTNYLPNKIQTSKYSQPLEDRITYYDYDDKGNPLEVFREDGTHIVYIWGYNEQYPIAKIENASFITNNPVIISANQQNKIDVAVLASNSDTNTSTENTLRTELESLRAAFPNAIVTTYTYDPLVGITSMTDPKGYTVYYEYDSFNRLKQVKDAAGNILTKNDYNYKNQ